MAQKNRIIPLLAMFLLFSLKVGAQIKEGHFQYVILTAPADTSIESQQKIGMVQDSKMDIFFTQNKTRMDFHVGTMFYSCMVVDNAIQRALSLNKNPQGSFAVYIGKEALEKGKIPDTTSHIELMNETRVILGFECKKAILYKNNEVTIYWYTDQIQIDMNGNPMLNPLLPGFPLSFITVKDGMRIEYLVSNYETELKQKDLIFSLMVPEGYRLISNGF